MTVSVWDSVFLLSHVELHLTRYRCTVRGLITRVHTRPVLLLSLLAQMTIMMQINCEGEASSVALYLPYLYFPTRVWSISVTETSG